MKVTTHMLGTRRVGQFVDLKALDTNATVQEAITRGYVVGKQELVVAAVCGVIRSMAASVSKDGNGRKIDGYVSIQPSVRCKLADDCEPLTRENVVAALIAHVLKEGAIDASDWTITVEGGTGSINITVVTTGEALNEVFIGKPIYFNGTGTGIPDTATMTWVATSETQTKSGSITSAKRTCTATRITTAADVLSSLTGSGWDGATIVFTINDNGRKAIKAATLRVAA